MTATDAAPLSQTARVVDALRAKVEAEGPVAAAAAPAAEAEVADDSTGDAPAVDVTEETPAEAPAAEATADVAEGGDES